MPAAVLVPPSLAALVADLLDDDGLDQAACRAQPEMWDGDPLPGEDLDARDNRHQLAIRVCHHCPCRHACATLAASIPERSGVWGARIYRDRPPRAAGAA